jgi:hypothetical protein
MGADDAESALERLLRLGLRGPVEREIVRVLIDCAGQEAVYNVFYGAVGVKLCNYHNRLGTRSMRYHDAYDTALHTSAPHTHTHTHAHTLFPLL